MIEQVWGDAALLASALETSHVNSPGLIGGPEQAIM